MWKALITTKNALCANHAVQNLLEDIFKKMESLFARLVFLNPIDGLKTNSNVLAQFS